MERKPFILTALTVALFFTSSAAFPHHGVSVYDMAKTTTMKATITEFEWAQPHCQIHFDVTNDKGVAEHWTLEAPPPSMLGPREWVRKSLQAGDVVTIEFHAAKNGSAFGIVQKVSFPDGKVLHAYPDR